MTSRKFRFIAAAFLAALLIAAAPTWGAGQPESLEQLFQEQAKQQVIEDVAHRTPGQGQDLQAPSTNKASANKMSNPFNCIPTCDPTDGRFLVLANGTSFITLSDQRLALQIQVPAGTPSFEIGIFDGDGTEGGVGSFWDLGSRADFTYSLEPDPLADSTGGPPIVTVASSTMPNNDWFPITINPLPGDAAESPNGNFFYILRIELVGPMPLPDTLNAFKIRTSEIATIEPSAQPFSYIANWTNGNDIPIIFPEFFTSATPDTPTTYDGFYSFFFNIRSEQDELALWDGDFDRGEVSGLDPDGDDVDTPNIINDFPTAPFPPWNSAGGNTEGVAIGLGPSTGNPPDDNEQISVIGPFVGQFITRNPSVEYDLIFPNGFVVENLNPSGNQEWEQLVISSLPGCDDSPACVPGPGNTGLRYGAPCADSCIANPLPPGVYEMRVRGVDMQNLNALRLPEQVVCVDGFGNACETIQPFDLGDTVFLDDQPGVNAGDGNGVQDAGEAGIPGVVMNLRNFEGRITDSTTTDATGNYSFEVPVGASTVEVANANFSDPVASGALGDRVWLDVNGDGSQTGEPGIANVVVNLYEAGLNGVPGGGDDVFVATAFTDTNGQYFFADLPPGTYFTDVNEDSVPAGLALTGGTNPSGTRIIVSSEVFLDLDFGYGNGMGATAILGDFVWSDADGDGVQDAGEPGIGGVTLDLIDATSTVVATTTTNADGSYLFTGLAPGSYSVDVTDTDGVLAGYSLTAGPESNPDPTAAIALAAGEVNLSADFGYNNPALVDVSDVVWFDTDRDGIFDGGESGLGGVTVSLIGPSGDVVASTVTDGTGSFTFEGVADGLYTIWITDTANTLAGLRATTPPALASVLAVEVVGANVSGINFGYVDTGALVGLAGTTLKAPEADFDAQTDTVVDDNILTYDFGYSVTASVGDRLWEDINGDGIQDAGEPGINGVTVNLLDSGGSVIRTAITSGDGGYLFADLRPGNYTVQVDASTLPGGAVQTGDPDGTLDNMSDVTLGPGDARDDIDFGYQGTASVGDRLWNDTNGDGIQDAGETGINGVTVNLLDSGGNVIRTTTTAGDGNYNFGNLFAGDYTVVVDSSTLPAGVVQTGDPDGTLDNMSSVTLNAGDARDDVDFGYQPELASIGDRVWLDSNGDGVQDAGEQGINGLMVSLFDDGGVLVATTITTDDGNYLFPGLDPGTYTVVVDRSPLTGLEPTFDLDGIGTADQATVTVLGGQDRTDVDFGYNEDSVLCATRSVRDPSLLSIPGFDGHAYWLPGIGLDFVFDPSPGTIVIRDDGTATVTGTIRRLSAPTEAFESVLDMSGLRALTPLGSPKLELDPGAYSPGGPIDPSTWFYYENITGTLIGIDDFAGAEITLTRYDDALQVGFGANGKNGNFGASAWLETTIVSQPSNGTVLAFTDKADINIDIVDCPLGSIGDRVWQDNNGDGVQDSGEPGINGVTVNLVDAGGNVIDSQVTTGDGNYTFGNLLPGDYTVVVDSSTLPGGLGQTGDPDGTLDDMSSVSLGPGEDRDDLDFGYQGTGSIGDRVWQDTNGDGIQDASETGINGVTVNLLDAGGNVIATQVTSGDGNYTFNNLFVGQYTVPIVTSTLPAGIDNPTGDPDGTLDNQSTLTLGDGENRSDIDFGYRGSSSIGDRVWQDDNGNGGQDASEAGINGVTASLLDSTGAVIATQVTSGDGNYTFGGLAPAGYTVWIDQSTLPAGYSQTGDPDGTLDSMSTLTLGPSEDRVDIDFGYQPPLLGSIGDRVWIDTNGDGVQDGAESGINGLTVRLLDSGGTVITTQVTSGDGNYTFGNLPSGDYTIEVDTSGLVGFVQTGDPDGTFDDRSDVNLGFGENRTDIDFGYQPEDGNESICLPKLNFDSDAAGQPLVAGQIIDDEWAAFGVFVTTNDPINHPAMIFDSANPTGGDNDLGTPNQAFGGPGIGSGGGSGPGENSVPRGNVLILSEDGDSSDPDDNGNGGTMIFTFAQPVFISSVDILDIDSLESMGTVDAYDGSGALIVSAPMQQFGNNSAQTVVVGAAGVERLEVVFPKSGAVADIVFCVEEEEKICLDGADVVFNNGGHAFWLPGISTDLQFIPVGNLNRFDNGTAIISGLLVDGNDPDKRFLANVSLTGETTTAPVGSPKKQLPADQYVENGGTVDTSTFTYYTGFSGLLIGEGDYAGAILELQGTGAAFQLGFGASNKNLGLGASAWFTWTVVDQPTNGTQLPDGQGDINVDFVDCVDQGECVEGNFRDNFDSATFSGDDGSLSWSGDWMEAQEELGGDGPGAGQVRVDGGFLRLDDYPNTGGHPSAAREADLSGAQSAIFSFAFDTSHGVDADDAIAVEVSSDGGATWTVIDTITNISGEVWDTRSYDISAFISAETQVRFRVANKYGGSNEFFFVDWADITVSCDDTGEPLGSISGTVWNDDDGNGVQEDPATGLGNITVKLMQNGNILAMEQTDGLGNYTFDGLAVGTYQVVVDASTLPAGVNIPTYDLDGIASANSANLGLGGGQDRNDADFGYRGESGGCSGCEHYTGWLSQGSWDAQPDGSYYYSDAGTHEAWLEGPSTADFDLYLYKWNGSQWVMVAQSATYDTNEDISYNGRAGYYFWMVEAYSGSGDYEIWIDRP